MDDQKSLFSEETALLCPRTSGTQVKLSVDWWSLNQRIITKLTFRVLLCVAIKLLLSTSIEIVGLTLSSHHYRKISTRTNFFALLFKERKVLIRLQDRIPSVGNKEMDPSLGVHKWPSPPQTPQLSRVLFDPTMPSHPTFCGSGKVLSAIS